jgi:beta-mannosidase
MKYSILIFFIVSLASCQSELNDSQTLDLNGDWRFRKANDDIWTKAQVPGVVQLDMLKAGLIEDPFYGENEKEIAWIELENWEYQRNFEVDKALLNQDVVDLVFEGLDTYAEVKVNGQVVLKSDNMFCTWRVDCKEQLIEGDNLISVLFKSPIKENEAAYNSLGYRLPAGNDAGDLKVSPFVRKSPYHFGWDWGPRIVTMGIWRPVRLEAYSRVRIQDVYFEQKNVSPEWANITTLITLKLLEKSDLELVIKDGNQILVQQQITAEKGVTEYALDFDIKNPELWWSNGLGEPHLYNWIVELKKDSQVLASNRQRVGLRTIELLQESDSIGTNYYFKLNGVPVFMKGANYIPQDNLLPRVTTAKYKKLIQNAVAANMNMLRVWGGGIYENDIFYDLCDKNGILVWQDFMFACSMYPSDKDFQENVKKEVQQNVKRLRNHACIALWCGNNEVDMAWKHWGWQAKFGYSEADSTTITEGYKTLFHELIPNELKALKTHRNYVSTSPLSNWGTPKNFNHHSMHYWGVWHNKEPFENYKTNVGRFMSEYGFQSFPEIKTIESFADSTQWSLDSEVMKHHQKSYIGNGMIQQHLEQYFPQASNFKEFVYLSQLTQALGIGIAINSHRRDRRCMGTLYWQINDCWTGPSWSSIDYFGRWKALHYKVKDMYKNLLVNIEEGEKQLVEITLISDKLKPIIGRLKLELINFEGKLLWEKEQEITIAANTAQKVYQHNFSKLLKSNSLNELFLKVSYTSEEQSDQQVHYFAPPKELKLVKATIQKQIKKVAGGYELQLFSPTLIKNLLIQVPTKEISFSDNYFDLLPKEQTLILIEMEGALTAEEIDFMTVNKIMNK